MKLLFVIPPYFDAEELISPEKNSSLPAFTIPYGILSMEAYLNENFDGLQTRILDLNVTLAEYIDTKPTESYSEFFSNKIKIVSEAFKADVVGLSALFNTSNVYLKFLSDSIADHLPEAFVIAGGGLPSAAYESILETCPSIYAICKGEGELPLLDLLNAKNKKQLVLEHPTWICRQGLKEKKLIVHSFIDNLDQIPVLNYDLPDIKENFTHYNNRSIDKTYTAQKKREFAIHTSRGCPFLCVFCSNPSLHGRKARYMSVNRVIAEVTRMKEEFGLTVLLIEDDHFFNDKDRAKEILRRLATLKIRIEFPNGLAVYAIDDEMARLLGEAGASAVALAVESGSEYVLNKIIKKPLKKHLIKPAVDRLRRYGVKAHVFIVCGLPGETDEHRQETLEMLEKTGFDWVHIFLAMPIFGSRLYDICVENGYIENPDSGHFIATKSVIRAPGIDPEKLTKYAYETQLEINFVNNHNMKIGRYDIALDYFNNVVDRYPNHALALFYSGKCYEAIGNKVMHKIRSKQFDQIINSDKYWSEMRQKFRLPKEA